ncbi:MAG: hypothetical protein ABJN26_21645 [Stappiaceae bacterium]
MAGVDPSFLRKFGDFLMWSLLVLSPGFIYYIWKDDQLFSAEFASIRLAMWLLALLTALMFARLFRTNGLKNFILVSVLGIVISALISGGLGLLIIYLLRDFFDSMSPYALIRAFVRYFNTVYCILAFISPLGIALGCYTTRERRQNPTVCEGTASDVFK